MLCLVYCCLSFCLLFLFLMGLSFYFRLKSLKVPFDFISHLLCYYYWMRKQSSHTSPTTKLVKSTTKRNNKTKMYHRVWNCISNTGDSTSGAVYDYTSRAHKNTPGFSGVLVTESLYDFNMLCLVYCCLYLWSCIRLIFSDDIVTLFSTKEFECAYCIIHLSYFTTTLNYIFSATHIIAFFFKRATFSFNGWTMEKT